MNEETEESNEPLVTRARNMAVIILVEGDILVDGDSLQHVSEGEITVYADGTVEDTRGELAPIDKEAVAYAIAAGQQIFNMSDV